MARTHSHKRGKSGSKKPVKRVISSWVKYKAKEIELLITKYGKEGKNPSKIGILLRDEYGIPDTKVITGKTITKILHEKKLIKGIPEDMIALIKRSLAIRKHLEANKHDQTARIGLTLTDNKINKLARYYKRMGTIEKDWKFDPAKAKIYLG
ncbi:MAG: 30S ribosomal protein S15 [Nanoarchaeota archaeon]